MKKNDVGRTIILAFLIVVAFMCIVAIVFRPAAVSSFTPGPGMAWTGLFSSRSTSSPTQAPIGGFDESARRVEADESYDSGPYETMGPKPVRYAVNAPIPCDGFGTGTCFTRA